jgi:hypothetical protein
VRWIFGAAAFLWMGLSMTHPANAYRVKCVTLTGRWAWWGGVHHVEVQNVCAAFAYWKRDPTELVFNCSNGSLNAPSALQGIDACTFRRIPGIAWCPSAGLFHEQLHIASIITPQDSTTLPCPESMMR